jgi:hypothetical protein
VTTSIGADTHPVIGQLSGYEGAEFREFITPTARGLAMVRGDRLDILAIATEHEGRGEFSRFLAKCKENYSVIGIWEIWNPILKTILARKDFHAASEVLAYGELSNGMIWEAPHED